jgi:hypothetical protein
VAKLADADVKGLALEVTAEVLCDGINGFDSPGPSRRHEVPFRASLKHSSTDSQTCSACDRDGRPFPAGPGRHTRRWIDHVISLAINAASRDRKMKMVTSSSGSTNARNPLPATAL